MKIKTIEQLTEDKNRFIKAGLLEPEDTVTARSFVVGREFDSNGILINPLIQFQVRPNDFLLSKNVVGKKVGDVVEFKEFGTTLEILEIYRSK